MELIIGNKIESEKPTNVYAVTVSMMHGDADGYNEDVCYIPEERADILKLLLETLQQMDNSSRDDYDDIPYFGVFFRDDEGSDVIEDEDELDTLKSCGFSWKMEATGWGDYTSYSSHEVTYFNSAGEEFEVEVKYNIQEDEQYE